MDMLSDTWSLWMIFTALVIGISVFYRQSKKSNATVFTSAEDFTIRSTLFNVRKGEGDIFMGFLIAMVCFSLGAAGFVRWVSISF